MELGVDVQKRFIRSARAEISGGDRCSRRRYGWLRAAALTLVAGLSWLALPGEAQVQPKMSLVLEYDMVRENGGRTKVTATLSESSSALTMVTVSAASVAPAVASDFTLSANTILTIAAGETTSAGTVTITSNDNSVYDSRAKRVAVSATAANSQGLTGPEDPVELTLIEDDSAPTVIALSVNPFFVSEGDGMQTVEVTATLVPATVTLGTATDVTVSVGSGLAIVTTDFAAVSDFTVTIPSQTTGGSATFDLIPVEDALVESSEFVTVSGMAAGFAVDVVALIITDDDQPGGEAGGEG